MPSIRKRNGKHFVEIRLKGHPPERATFIRLTDARKWAQATEAAIREGRYFKTTEARRHTLDDAVVRYLRTVAPGKKDGKGDVTKLTWWADQLGAYSLADITAARIAECRDELAESRKAATVVRYLASLSHMFTVAVREWGWLESNPVRRVTKPKEPKGRVRFLSLDERDRLLAACAESKQPQLHLIVLLAISTGMRRGEIAGLRWSDVDLAAGRMVLQDTKNGERRMVPLSGPAMDGLQAHGKVRRIDSDYVFPGNDRSRPLNFQTAWKAALKAAAIDDFRFHDLRHTAASYLLMSGASTNELAEILGHKTLQMVKRYSHMSDSHAATLVARMNERFLAGA